MIIYGQDTLFLKITINLEGILYAITDNKKHFEKQELK
jgi:hypothetical protein